MRMENKMNKMDFSEFFSVFVRISSRLHSKVTKIFWVIGITHPICSFGSVANSVWQNDQLYIRGVSKMKNKFYFIHVIHDN